MLREGVRLVEERGMHLSALGAAVVQGLDADRSRRPVGSEVEWWMSEGKLDDSRT